MPIFGTRSRAVLAELDPRLQDVLREAIKLTDFALYEGYRSLSRQQELYEQRKSKARPGESKHNTMPSKAVDLWAYPINWEDTQQQAYVAGIILGIASQMEIPMRWGHDWDMDGDTRDNGFNDGPHFELME